MTNPDWASEKAKAIMDEYTFRIMQALLNDEAMEPLLVPAFAAALRAAHEAGRKAGIEESAIRGRIAQLEEKLVDVEIRKLAEPSKGGRDA